MTNINISTDFKGLWSPSELIFSDLTLYQERLLAIIWGLDKIDTPGCYSKNAYLSKLSKIKGVSNIVKQLIGLGHLHRTVIYKNGTQEVDKRYLKVISPLLLTEERKRKDKFLANLFTPNEDPIHLELRPPSFEMNTPLILNESYNIIDNKEDKESLSLDEKSNSDSNFSDPIDTTIEIEEDGNAVDVSTLINSDPATFIDSGNLDKIAEKCIRVNEKGDFDFDGACAAAMNLGCDSKLRASIIASNAKEIFIKSPAGLISLWKERSLSNKTFVQRWLKTHTEDKVEELAAAAAAGFIKKFFAEARNERAAAMELKRRLEGSLGMRESTYLNSWILREDQFNRPNHAKSNHSQQTQQKPRGKNHDYEGQYQKYMEMADEYFGTSVG